MIVAALTFTTVLALGWAIFERIDKLSLREYCERLEEGR